MHKRKNFNHSSVQMPNPHDFENKNNVIFFMQANIVKDSFWLYTQNISTSFSKYFNLFLVLLLFYFCNSDFIL